MQGKDNRTASVTDRGQRSSCGREGDMCAGRKKGGHIALMTAGLLAAILIGAAAPGGLSVSASASAEDTVTLVMIGDMLMHTGVLKSGLGEDGSYSFDHLFSHVRSEIAAADIAIVNQETILGGQELNGYTGYPAFNSPYALGDAEVHAGFDVILHGTNHALDRSARGIENCLAWWGKTWPAIPVLGIHDSAGDQSELCILEAGGMRIAVLNYTYGTNGIPMPKGKGYLVDYLREDRVRADIERAEEEADFTVVCPHWGTEYSLGIDSSQKKWTSIFLESGADLVIGTHPHVIEPIERVRDDGGREMLVYYSLGNFVNATSGKGKGVMNRAVGGMARVTLKRNAKGQAEIADADVLPVVCHLGGREGVTAWFLSDYTEELAMENGFRNKDPAFSLASCKALVRQVWKEVLDEE